MSIEKLARGEELTIGEQNVLVSEYDEMRRNVRLLRGLIAGATRHVQADELTVYGDAEIGSDLTIGGDAEIGDALYVSGACDVVGTLDVGGNAGFGASINVVANANIHGIGQFGSSSSYAQLNSSGVTHWVGGGGLVFGEIYANNASDTITISSAGEANKVQVTSFDTVGHSNNMTPSSDNDDITVLKAGVYLCTISLHIESVGGGGADTFGFSAYKNNGAAELADCHAHRRLSGGGGDVGSVSMSGLLDLAVNDTVELWTWNEDSTDNVVIDDLNMSLVMIGGV